MSCGCHPKICDFQGSVLGDEHVSRFDVPVNHLHGPCGVLHTVAELDAEVQGTRDIDPSFLDPIPQVAAINILHHDINLAMELLNELCLHDVGVQPQLNPGVGLPLQGLLGFFVPGFLLLETLQGHQFLEDILIIYYINRAHTAFADDLSYLISAPQHISLFEFCSGLFHLFFKSGIFDLFVPRAPFALPFKPFVS